jgi:general L-amino acid transport system substrate-binding protein
VDEVHQPAVVSGKGGGLRPPYGQAALLCLLLAAAAPKPDTTTAIRSAQSLACGVVAEPEDWSRDDAHGPLSEFDTEICRAVAAAALGSAAKASIQAYPAEADALDALSGQKIDLAVGVTPSVTAAITRHIGFGPVLFWDRGGFLVRADAGASTPAALAGKRVCFIEGTRMEPVLQARYPAIIRLPYQEEGEMEDALASGACQAVAGDFSKLFPMRGRLGEARFLVMAEPSTLDPLSYAVRDGDARWSALVSCVIQALIQAEASGMTAANAGTLRPGDDPDRQLLTGADWASAAALGLPHDWALRMLSETGNYGEIFVRTVQMPRGLNALWRDGGLLTPLPLR